MRILTKLFAFAGFILTVSPPVLAASDNFENISPDVPAKPAKKRVFARDDSPNTPASDDIPKTSDSMESVPKYRAVFEKASKKDRSYGDEESVSAFVGVGFGFSSFLGSLGIIFPIQRYVAWSVSGQYLSRYEHQESEMRTDGLIDLIVRIPNPTPLTPFVSTGPGYEMWKRTSHAQGEAEVFDQDSSPTGNWAVGSTLRLGRYVSLVGALKSTTFFDRPPKIFAGDHSSRERRSNQRFELGFAFIF